MCFLLTRLYRTRARVLDEESWALLAFNLAPPPAMSLQSFPATADDVRDARRVLASWSLDKYLAVREEQRAKGEAPRDLVWLRHNATLEEALQTLSTHKILSAPSACPRYGYRGLLARADLRALSILQLAVLDAYSGDFMGFFGLGDLLKWLLKGLYPTLLNTELNTPEAMQEYIKQAPPNLNLNNRACRLLLAAARLRALTSARHPQWRRGRAPAFSASTSCAPARTATSCTAASSTPPSSTSFRHVPPLWLLRSLRTC